MTSMTRGKAGCMSGRYSLRSDRNSTSKQLFELAFLIAAGLLFVTSTALTAIRCQSMSQMGSMPMPSGWSMSMAWMRMPGQSWPSAAASFLGMWAVMMTAMMFPSSFFMLSAYRKSVSRSLMSSAEETKSLSLTALVAVAYFSVWTGLGIVVYGLGVSAAETEIRYPVLARLIPTLAALCVLGAGAVQFSRWKEHHLVCCRRAPEPGLLPANVSSAWRQGLSFGFHCSCSCLNLTVILLVLGVMDLRAMAVVTAGITLERLAPAGKAVTCTVGVLAIGLGSVLLLSAAAQLGSLAGINAGS